MSQYTNTAGYNALLIPDERLVPETWDGGATPQAGARPGQAVPQSSNAEATLVVSGTQTTDTTYSVYATKGGFANTAEIAWSAVVGSGSAGDTRGCNLPNLMTDIHHVLGGVSVVTTAGSPATCTTNTGRVVYASCVSESVGSTKSVFVSYTDDLVTITAADDTLEIISDSDASDNFYGVSFDGLPCVALFFDEERTAVQLYVRVVDPVNTQTQFYLFESTDDAETWELVQRNCLDEPYIASDTLRRPVVSKSNGVTVLLQPEDDASTTYTLSTFISLDHGRTFTLLESDASGMTEYSVVNFKGFLRVGAIEVSSNDAKLAKISSPYDSIIQATYTTVPTLTDEATIALSAIHGRLYVHTVNTSHYKMSTVSSITGDADDCQPYGGHVFSLGSAGGSVDIEDIQATPAFGGLSLVFKVTDTGASTTFRQHIFAMRLGGWSTFTMPRTSPSSAYREGQAAWGLVNASTSSTFYGVDRTSWLPFLAPDAMAGGGIWTASGTGTDAAGLSEGGSPYRSVSCLAGTSRYWAQDFTCDPASGVLVYFDCSVSTGGDVTSNDSAVRVVISNGATAAYNLTVRLSASGGVYLKDNTGGASLMVAADIVNRHAFIVAMRETDPGTTATCTIYSVGYGALDNIQDWEELDTFTLTADGTPPASSSVEMGVIGAGSAVAIEQKWYGFDFIAAEGILGIYDASLGGFINRVSQLRGAPLSAQPLELNGGTKVSLTNGPVKKSETWTIAPKYDYAREHVYPHLYPSPRQSWRSIVDGSDQTFQWLFDPVDEAPQGLGSAVWGAAVIGANFANWTLDGFTAAGAWENILTVDSSDEFTSLPYRASVRATFTGAYVTVNTGGTGSASRYIHENELAGGTVKIGSNYFKILRNTSGYWSTAAGKKPVLFLETWDSSVASTGTLDIWPPNCLALKTGLGSTEYRKLRFVITASDTADGYYDLGQLVIGPVYLFGKRYSKGRVLSRDENGVVNYTTGGASNPVVYGPTYRTAEFGWFEGIDQTQVYRASTAEPDYVTTGDATGVAHAAAARHDTPTNLDGLYVRLSGGNTPLVYIPNIPYDATEAQFTSTDGRTINGFVYGRLQGGVKLTTVTGKEQSTEVAQIASIKIREDV